MEPTAIIVKDSLPSFQLGDLPTMEGINFSRLWWCGLHQLESRLGEIMPGKPYFPIHTFRPEWVWGASTLRFFWIEIKGKNYSLQIWDFERCPFLAERITILVPRTWALEVIELAKIGIYAFKERAIVELSNGLTAQISGWKPHSCFVG